ncbi:outer membrane protein assembly factor BamA [Novosphingobium sp. B 225]|uniref:outer membrane protein assembly factor BamA n=1 Tax=Novosphingobium sp. B 225 TaxID=1961849 RepID=UPI0020CEBA86|nr:outer membrane protein assembly factor BamA [Novosphingobium sp. B 225]
MALLGTTILAGVPSLALAQTAPAAPAAPAAEPAPAPVGDTIQSITVTGAQRLEPDTIRSYIKMRIGQTYTQVVGDMALKDLFATELFSDVQVSNNQGAVTITVKENPVINRIILEGNKRLKEEKILPEIKLAPRQIFTRSKVRADVARIIELYKRQGRFAAEVEPKMVLLDQNRVDIVFEVQEGPKSKVRKINIIGNEHFGDGELRGEMVTKQTGLTKVFSSGTSYDPDRMAFDQQKLRQFYLTKGYADFRIVSAVAELTPDKKDFILTYVVEEGLRYKFGDVKVESQLRDFDGDRLAAQLPMKKDDWYNAKLVEDTIDRLNETAGTFGYAFADVRPNYDRNKDDLSMGITFQIAEAPRVYVERIDVNGNTLTQDKVVRREFRLAEGDAFNSLQVKRSTNRINSLGYFQEKFEVEQRQGSAADRIILEANVEEKPTGELQLSAGYSSLEKLIFQGSIQQRNFRGRGQTVGLSLSYSQYSKSAEVSFTEPYLFDRNVSLGVNLYRRDYNSFNYLNSSRNTTYKQSTTGMQVRAGIPLTEFMSAVGSYTLNYDDVSLDKTQFFSDRVTPGVLECDPLQAGRYLCEAIGKRTSSILGLSLIYDSLDNRVRPTRGRAVSVSAEFAGLGGSVKYGRVRLNAAQYYPVGKGFIFSLRGEAGAIKAIGNNNALPGADPVRLTDRFYLGEPDMRGFDIRGVGPRILRKPFDTVTGKFIEDRNQWIDDALGGRYYYLAHMELEIPLGSGAKEMGLRPSVFLDAGSVWSIKTPQILSLTFPYTVTCNGASKAGFATSADGIPTLPATCTGTNDAVLKGIPFQEFYSGNSPQPRISVGVGVNWNSPFGPFRIDFAKVLLKRPGDDTKSFTFNVGTQF